ncbi:LysR family transcriptional regulator [Celerinatantimonas sp. MCCC 1A17872]|uniref:LysR family transcriptional regulator n=1 Tax=Celerinatantimonas sp. MCCC 1A17872 TaxID=3177514 RepID=UPI0038C235B8
MSVSPSNINLRQIEIFRAIMVTGSISGASRLLMVSQPAISRMLSYTEQRTGLTLFERIKGRLYPSPEARRLFQDVEHVYRDVQRVNTTIKDLLQQQHGILRIASSPSLGHCLLPPVIAQFREQYPDMRVSLECVRHILLRDRLLDGYVDLAISLFPIEHPNLEVSKLLSARLLFVAPKDHPLAQREQLTLAELENESFIGYMPETPFCELTQAVFEEEDTQYLPTIEASSPQYACSMAKAGVGITLVDEFSYSVHQDNLAVLPIKTPYRLNANLIHLRQSPLSQMARLFVEQMQDYTANEFTF